jgi:mannose-6-phosphate isomerase-like protein (cupin superfamily)
VGVIAPGGGEVIGDAPDRRVEILSDHPAINATLSRFGPGRDGADLHVHRRHSDLFYVLEGELTVRLGVEDRAVAVPAGSAARIPPGVVHGFRNATGARLRYLNLHVPGERFADYLRGLRDGRPFAYDQFDPPVDGGRPSSEAAIGPPPVRTEAIDLVERAGARDEEVHAHDDRVESLYVLEGEAVLTLGDEELRAPAGSWAEVAPGVPHALRLPERTRCLSLHCPTAAPRRSPGA